MAVNTWNLNSVTANTETDLVVPAVNKAAQIASLYICNYSGAQATITVKITDAANAQKAMLFSQPLSAGQTIPLTQIALKALAASDKVRVISTQANVSFYANGDES